MFALVSPSIRQDSHPQVTNDFFQTRQLPKLQVAKELTIWFPFEPNPILILILLPAGPQYKRKVKVLEHHFETMKNLRGLWIGDTSAAKVFKFKRNPWRSGNELIQIREAYPNQKHSFWLILAFQRAMIITKWWFFEGRDLKNDLQPLVSINTNWPFSSRWRWRWDFQATLASSETRPLPIQGELSPIIHDHPYKHGLITTSWSS